MQRLSYQLEFVFEHSNQQAVFDSWQFIIPIFVIIVKRQNIPIYVIYYRVCMLTTVDLVLIIKNGFPEFFTRNFKI